MKWLSFFRRQPPKPLLSKIYIDKTEGLEFIYYTDKNQGAVLYWLRDKLNNGKINANIYFAICNNDICVFDAKTRAKKIIPKDKVIVLSFGKVEIVDKRCLELLYGKSIAKL